MNEAQDPGELFDVVRFDGTPTGVVKPRALVHRDGDWHRSVHVWVMSRDEQGEPGLLVQQRSMHKDTWPGYLDATVGGHYRAGETLAEALREVKEELGIPLDPAPLRPLGRRVCVNDGVAGSRDFELQDLFLLRDDRPLMQYHPHPAELAALVRFPLAALLPFLAGVGSEITGEARLPGGCATLPMIFGREDFIPNVDNYFFRVAVAAANALRGDEYVAA